MTIDRTNKEFELDRIINFSLANNIPVNFEGKNEHRKSSGISRAASQAMLAAALATGTIAAPSAVKADTAITQTAEQRVNPYLGQTREFDGNVLDMGVLYGVFDQYLQYYNSFQDVERVVTRFRFTLSGSG